MTAIPALYDAEEAGRRCRRSANWMKTNARAGTIPFRRMGRAMAWTDEDIAEIIRESLQPAAPAGAVPVVRRKRKGRRAGTGGAVPVVRVLNPKPRRERGAA